MREKAAPPGGAWEQVRQLISMPQLGVGTPDTIDITTLESIMMESIPALPSPDEMTFEFRAMPYDMTNSNTKYIIDLDRAKTYEYQVRNPKLGVQITWEGMCVHNFADGGVNTAQNITLTTMISGAFVEEPLTP